MRRGTRTNVAGDSHAGRFARGPKHHAALAVGGGEGPIDSLHNDDLPCCLALQSIAMEILPPLAAAAPVVPAVATSNSNNNNNNNSNNNNPETNTKPSKRHTHDAPNVSNAEGLVDMIREFLWNQFWWQKQQQQQQLEEGGSQHLKATASKKKRKKKKKKKPKAGGDDEKENGVAAAGEEQDVDSPNNDTTATTAQTTSATLPRETTRPDSVARDKPMEIEQHKATTTSTTTKAKNEATATEPYALDRNWWLQCYLDRVAAEREDTATQSSSFPKETLRIHEFLRVMSHKLNFSQTNKAASPLSASNGQGSTHNTSAGAQTTNNNNSNNKASKKPKDNCNNAASTTSMDFHVSQKDLKNMALKVQCGSCRSRVNNFLTNCTKIPLLPLNDMFNRKRDGRRQEQTVLAQHIQEYGDEDEFPFDYVAMEEGNAVRPNQNDYLQKGGGGVTDDLQGAWLYLQAVQTDEGETLGWRLQKKLREGNTNEPRDELTLDDFSFLLREFFLLPAVGYDTLLGAVDAQTLTVDKISMIQKKAGDRYSHMLEQITAWVKELEEQLKKLSLVTGPPGIKSKDPVNMMGSVTLNDCDAGIADVLKKLLRNIMMMTDAYQQILSYWNNATFSCATMGTPTLWNEQSPLPSRLLGQLDTITYLWKMYLDALAQIQRLQAECEGKIFALADTRGNLPSPMFNPDSRRLVDRLLQQKVVIVLSALDNVKKKLDNQQDVYETPAKVYRPTFMRSLFNQHALIEVLNPNFANPANESPSSKSLRELKDACEDVLWESQQSWCQLRQQRSIEQVHEAYQGQREKMERLLKKAHEMLEHQKQAHGSLETDDGSYLAAFLSQISTEGSESKTIENVLPVLRSEMAPALQSMVKQWLNLSIQRRSNNPSTAKPLILPLRLIQTMSSDESNEVPSSPGMRCQGSDGSLRATCLIMTLFFSWLVECHNEWQAELAEKELLNAMGENGADDILGVDAPQSATSKKKSKKKKNKALAAAAEEKKKNGETTDTRAIENSVSKEVDDQSRDITHATNSFDSLGTKDDNVAQIEMAQDTMSTAETTKSSPLTASNLSENEEEDSPQKQADVHSHQETMNGSKESPKRATNAPKETLQKKKERKPQRSTVGVLDGSKFIPAETFMLQRLLDVMENADGGKKTKPIVML